MQVIFILGNLIFSWVLALIVNYLSDVLPLTRSFTLPVCRPCQHKISILDYIALRKCSNCGSKRSTRTWVIQALIPLIFIWLMFKPAGRLNLWMSAIILGYFAVVAVIDYEHRAILYEESIVGAVIGLGAGYYLHGIVPTILGGVAGFGIMLVLYYLGILFARVLSHLRKQEYSDPGLGYGDVTLAGVLGLLLGWPGITAGLILGILLAGLVSAIYLVVLVITHRYTIFSSIPYAPFLVIGSAILLFRP
jgi:leader peptidase (prepilin peptidase)/N-methyltransferase